MKKSIQIVGSFITNYSLARVNRGLAIALNEIQDEYEISIWQDKEKIDKIPNENDIKLHPKAMSLWREERKESDVVIYNDFPKNGYVPHDLKNLPGKIKIMYLAWEESVFPKIWVDEINANLHGLMVASSFVRDVLRNAGIKIPIRIVLNALDENVRVNQAFEYPLSTKKNFKFLNISSARKRKGIDVLLKAYFEEFNIKDDVVLVLKSFPGPDNLVNELLAELKKDNSPEVIHIYNPDLTDQELTNLIKTCDVGVYPSRAEGFGIPIAESMFHERPVIATNYSAYLDFLNEESGYLIDYKLVDASDSEIVNLGAKWAEPDIDELKEKMRFLYENYKREDDKVQKSQSIKEMEIAKKINNAKKIAENLTWENSAKETLEFIKELEGFDKLKNKKAAVMSHINSEDGLSEYTLFMYSNIEKSFKEFYYIGNKDITDRVREDAENVVRVWETGETEFKDLLQFVKENGIDIFHVQYHSGFNYSVQALDLLIKELKNLGITTIVTLHAVRGNGFDIVFEAKNLKLADKIIIHNKFDYTYATEILNNVYLFPIPKIIFPKRIKSKVKEKLGLEDHYPIIVSHGLMNANKQSVPDILETIEELKEEYPNLLYLGLHAVSSNNVTSSAEYDKCIEIVKQKKLENYVRFFNEFLDLKYIEAFFQAGDVNILAYKDVGESASDAINKALASYNPTVITDIPMFSEFNEEVLKVPNTTKESLIKGIKTVLNDKELSSKITKASKEYVERNSYGRRALDMLKVYLGNV